MMKLGLCGPTGTFGARFHDKLEAYAAARLESLERHHHRHLDYVSVYLVSDPPDD